MSQSISQYHHSKRYTKRRKQKKRSVLLLSIIIFLFSIFFIQKSIQIFENLLSGNLQTLGFLSGKSASSDSDADIMVKLQSLTTEYPQINEILSNSDAYPQSLLKLLSSNIETLNFVYDYPKLKDSAGADSIGTVTKGKIPLLLQWDRRWGYVPYGDDIIALSGCGPTALSMVASGLTGDASLTPNKIAQYAQDNGYYVAGTGTSWSLISEGCQAFGVTAQELSLNEQVIAGQLQNGHPVICSMKPGDFTTSGHFIVLTGYQDGQFEVHDPNSKERSSRLWSFDRIQGQINNLWAFSEL